MYSHSEIKWIDRAEFERKSLHNRSIVLHSNDSPMVKKDDTYANAHKHRTHNSRNTFCFTQTMNNRCVIKEIATRNRLARTHKRTHNRFVAQQPVTLNHTAHHIVTCDTNEKWILFNRVTFLTDAVDSNATYTSRFVCVFFTYTHTQWYSSIYFLLICCVYRVLPRIKWIKCADTMYIVCCTL